MSTEKSMCTTVLVTCPENHTPMEGRLCAAGAPFCTSLVLEVYKLLLQRLHVLHRPPICSGVRLCACQANTPWNCIPLKGPQYLCIAS